MELLQKQAQRLNQQQLQSIELLQMGTLELECYLRDLAQENPLVDLDDSSPEPEDSWEDALLYRLHWLEDNDYKNLHLHYVPSEEEYDPLSRVGTDGGLEESLPRFLSRQLERMDLTDCMSHTIRYLASCLDENGYFRLSLADLSTHTGIPVPYLKQALDILRSLEPAGVGARNLAQCLELQLLRIGETGPALTIVRNHLDALAKHHYRAISAKLNLPLEEIYRAQSIIQELEPRPGAVFAPPSQIHYILPDIFIEESENQYVARMRNGEHPPFQINGYYRNLLAQSADREVHTYLSAKLRQAEWVLRAIDQRDSTLQRCAQVIARRQTDFFRLGPQALRVLRLSDVAQELGVHESTVSRAVRDKYLQCSWGMYPLNYFFSRKAASGKLGEQVGGKAARSLLRQIIDREDKHCPLSDQKLCSEMTRLGCSVSRRTVAKYREEMNIPGTSNRRIQET